MRDDPASAAPPADILRVSDATIHSSVFLRTSICNFFSPLNLRAVIPLADKTGRGAQIPMLKIGPRPLGTGPYFVTTAAGFGRAWYGPGGRWLTRHTTARKDRVRRHRVGRQSDNTIWGGLMSESSEYSTDGGSPNRL